MYRKFYCSKINNTFNYAFIIINLRAKNSNWYDGPYPANINPEIFEPVQIQYFIISLTGRYGLFI